VFNLLLAEGKLTEEIRGQHLPGFTKSIQP